MSANKIVVGTGVTKRARKRVNAPFSTADKEAIKQEFMRIARDRPWEFDSVLADSEQAALKILAAANLSADPDEVVETGDGPMAMATYIAQQEWTTIEWYAYQILNRAEVVRKVRTNGDIEMALVWSLRLGSLIKEAEFKFNFEADVKTGQKLREGGRKGAQRKKEQRELSPSNPTRWLEEDEKLRDSHSHIKSKSARAKKIGKICSDDWNTIRRHLPKR